jgi:DNA-binding MarR family transcriptional regulator
MNNGRQKLLQELIDKFTQTIHGIHKGQSFPFGDFILSQHQATILFFLYTKENESSVKEIAKFLHVTSGAVTQFVDGLIDKKLVKREENLSDRRVINIKLTETTKNQFADFQKKYFANASKAFGDLNDAEIKQLIKLIDKVKISED